MNLGKAEKIFRIVMNDDSEKYLIGKTIIIEDRVLKIFNNDYELVIAMNNNWKEVTNSIDLNYIEDMIENYYNNATIITQYIKKVYPTISLKMSNKYLKTLRKFI